MRRWIAFGSIQSIASSMMVLTGLFYLFRGSWLLGLIYLCSIPLMVLSLWFFIRKMKGLTRSSQEQSGDLATTVEESVQGIRVLKALGQGRNALGRFTGQSERLMDTEIQRAQTLGSVFIKTFVISAVTMALALWVGLHEVSAGQLSVGELTAFLPRPLCSPRRLNARQCSLACTWILRWQWSATEKSWARPWGKTSCSSTVLLCHM